ncbi:MAG: SPOR domain-containing protein [Deltaproteobacteria bacterium]|nr:SPOR domain-containing protein [Deltaproteobacteria bacterium]
MPCVACHVDPAGGGLRNDYGRGVQAAIALPLELVAIPDDAPPIGRLSDAVTMGSDLRVLYQFLRKTDAPQPRINSFYLMEAGLYVAADLWKQLTLYVAPVFFGNESIFFDAMGLVRLPFLDAYVKVGRFTPPYGIKLPNHSSFTRKRLGFNIRTKEVGAEVGLYPGPFSVQVAAFNGVAEADAEWDDNAAKGFSTRISALLKTAPLKLELGLSGFYNVAGSSEADDPSGVDTRIEDLRVGVFGGAAIGRFTYLGEVDYWLQDDRTAEAAVGQLISYQELGFLAFQGLDLVLTYELLDADVSLTGNAVHRIGGGLDAYLWPFSELSIIYRATVADPRAELARLHELAVVAHFYF